MTTAPIPPAAPSRRSVIEAAASVAAGVLGGAASTGPTDSATDAAVFTAAAARDEAWQAHVAACEGCDLAGVPWSDDAERTNKLCMEADRRLASTPARTLHGIVVKLRRLTKSLDGQQQLFYPDEFIEGLAADGERLLHGGLA